jgi:MFS transporter, PHS family, inorganic phosphate transporter
VHLTAGTAPRHASLERALDEAPVGRFHRRAVVVSGMGFFTDAYDLFVIATVAALASTQWHLDATRTSWVSGSAILGAFVGALVFGRIADLLGRKRVYVTVAAVMIAGALASALAPGYLWLVAARFVLGLGIGGDYPVSAVLMSEYANRDDRGRLVGLVFSMQAVGLVVGPLVAVVLLESGLAPGLAWRLLLALGAVPAAAVIYLRTTMPESPRFRAAVEGRAELAAEELAGFAGMAVPPATVSGRAPGAVAERAPGSASAGDEPPGRTSLRRFVSDRRMLRLVLGTAGAWFLFDYAYYGNTLSLPAILKDVDAHASLVTNLCLSLAMFVAFAVPGYALAVLRMDRIGHRRLQVLGFAAMAVLFLALGIVGGLTTAVGPFIAVFGLSYFFVEFGPNTTTFVLPSEVFPVQVRTTGHGTAAGIGKLGAFVGVFVVPQLASAIGLRGMLVAAGAVSAAGLAVTFVLPEPARRSLHEVSAGGGGGGGGGTPLPPAPYIRGGASMPSSPSPAASTRAVASESSRRLRRASSSGARSTGQRS